MLNLLYGKVIFLFFILEFNKLTYLFFHFELIFTKLNKKYNRNPKILLFS
jgi:hypothetical protein